jgi:Tol biopolymer transport system component
MASESPGSPPGLFRVALKSGAMRRITTPEPGGTGDWCPAYSPDGNVLAYLHNTGSRRLSPLYRAPVDKSGVPLAEGGRIETGSVGFTDLAWSADGKSIIGATPSGLVRVPLSGRAVQPLPFPDGSQPAVAHRGNSLVYVRPSRDTDIFRVAAPGAPRAVRRLISSTREEFGPQYSADVKRIAFVSDRTGSDEIWIATAEGENARQVTSFGRTQANAASVGSPRWSPDGHWIAFDSTAGPRPGIYVIPSNGGESRRITPREISGVRPSWSHDGRWIYFGSNPRGDWNIWKISPQSGSLVQVTRNGGREAFEAPGGEFLYYTKTPPTIGIWRLSVLSGAESKFSDAGTQGRWAIG